MNIQASNRLKSLAPYAFKEINDKVAKLREMKTDDHILLLQTNMDAGHGGASGRFESLKEVAMDYAFLLDLEGIKE